jgi:predicted NUDIX family NTP pyrophosphohydrolase
VPKISAGILLYRRRKSGVEVLLVHPGGPFWAKKDAGAWSIPKGEIDSANPVASVTESDLFAVARREFAEELGPIIAASLPPADAFVPLGQIRQKSGKVVHAWAAEGDCDPSSIQSNTFSIEWPPNSGNQREFPEIDRAAFFSLDEAQKKLVPAQTEFLDRLDAKLSTANTYPQ